AVKEIEHIRKQLRQPAKAEQATRKTGSVLAAPKIESNFKKPAYLAAIKKAKQYIRAGDIFQVVISQRFSAKTQAEPFQIYRELRALNPSPYLFFLQLNDVAVVRSSPRKLVEGQGRDVFLPAIPGGRWCGGDGDGRLMRVVGNIVRREKIDAKLNTERD